jgi:5-methylcytosine-specific restriction protein A
VEHKARQRRHTDQRRGSSTDRGYGSEHRERFRLGVLGRDGYVCQRCHKPGADTADHYPHSRRQLVEMGEDADDPRFGRALHAACHSSHTQTTEGQGKGNLQRG